MINQQQATTSIATIGIILGYVLWSIIGTGAFLPYIQVGTPHVGNILLFITLLSSIIAAASTVVLSLLATLISWLRKREHSIDGTAVWTTFVTFFLASMPAFILHIFSLVPLSVTLLSYALVCGIVGYGRLKEKNKYKKYLATDSRGTESKNPVKV